MTIIFLAQGYVSCDPLILDDLTRPPSSFYIYRIWQRTWNPSD